MASDEELVQRARDAVANGAPNHDLLNALADAVELLGQTQQVLVFADGLAVANTGFALADLYNEECEAQAALDAAGCWKRGAMRKESPNG